MCLNTSIASKTTTVGPQIPPFSSSGVSGAFAGSCSGGEVSTGGAGVGVSIFGVDVLKNRMKTGIEENMMLTTEDTEGTEIYLL